ncbi:transcriptional regulator, partial [Pseudomonas floridensis]
ADYLAAVANVGVDVLYVLTSRRTTGVELDNIVNRMSYASGAPDDIFVEVQQAVRHLVNTIEELSSTYDTGSRQPSGMARKSPVTAEQ